MKTSNIDMVCITSRLEGIYPGFRLDTGRQQLWTRALQENQVTKEEYDEARLFYGLHNSWR